MTPDGRAYRRWTADTKRPVDSSETRGEKDVIEEMIDCRGDCFGLDQPVALKLFDENPLVIVADQMQRFKARNGGREERSNSV